MTSAVAGGGRLVAADVAGCSRRLESLQNVPPVLPDQPDRSSAAQVTFWLFWVQRMLPEVEGGVRCSSAWMERSGRLLEVRGVVLGG